MRGTLKWFNKMHGYGFIMMDGKDVFFHHTELNMSKKEIRNLDQLQGEEMDFKRVEETERGMKAIGVSLVQPLTTA